jgi:membrane fusion protein, heavy metal efflux system
MKPHILLLSVLAIPIFNTSCSFFSKPLLGTPEAPEYKQIPDNTPRIGQSHNEIFHFPAKRVNQLRVDDVKIGSLPIKTELIETRKLPVSIILKGQIEPAAGKELDVSTRILGKVVQVMVHNGDTVLPGQVLAILDSQEISELAAELIEAKSKLQMSKAQKEREHQLLEETLLIPKALIEAKARLDEAKTQKDLTDSEYEREEGLLKEKIASQREYLSAQAAQSRAHTVYEVAKLEWQREKHLYENQAIMRKDFQLAEAEFVRASQHLDTLKQRLLFLGMDPKAIEELLQTGKISGTVRILAPQSGIINYEDVAAGEVVHTDHSMFKIIDLSDVVVRAGLPENDLSLVTVGKKVRVTAASYPDLVFTGTVDHISEQVNRENKTVMITAKLSNRENKLKINMSANLELEGPYKAFLSCPKSALLPVNDEQCVLLSRQNTYEARPIKTGLESRDFIEVRSGLNQGDKVVTLGAFALATILEQNNKK